MACNLFVMNNASPCINRLANTVEVQPFFEEMTGIMSGRMLLAMTLAASLLENRKNVRKKYRSLELSHRVCAPGEPERICFGKRKPKAWSKKHESFI